MNQVISDLQSKLGIRFFDYQLEAFGKAAAMSGPSPKRCLYYKTGAGKSITALVDMKLWDVDDVLVITPPSTYPQWEAAGAKVGIKVTCMSHAKFRMPGTLVSRHRAVIADEMHMFGGHGGQGWKKLDRLALHLQAPMVLASATPNYNDAERVYCIQHILDPHSVKGGYLQFLYAECNTEQNPFGMEPLVAKDQPFRNYPDAASYLAALPQVDYLPDDLAYTIDDIGLPVYVDPPFETYGYDRFSGRIIASIIEERHRRIFNALVDPNGYLNDEAYELLTDLAGKSTTPVLIYSNHSTVAEALGHSLNAAGTKYFLVTGKTPRAEKAWKIQAFIDGKADVLVGTASLATGTDGLDKVCDTLIILDDTDDDSLRRQLIGRIMPRGADQDASSKQVYRLVLQ